MKTLFLLLLSSTASAAVQALPLDAASVKFVNEYFAADTSKRSLAEQFSKCGGVQGKVLSIEFRTGFSEPVDMDGYEKHSEIAAVIENSNGTKIEKAYVTYVFDVPGTGKDSGHFEYSYKCSVRPL